MRSVSDNHSPVRCLDLQGLAVLSRQATNEILEKTNTLLHLGAI